MAVMTAPIERFGKDSGYNNEGSRKLIVEPHLQVKYFKFKKKSRGSTSCLTHPEVCEERLHISRIRP